MNGPIKKNHFIWLTTAMIGLVIVNELSREMPENLTLSLVQYTSWSLLLLSLLSLKTTRVWGKGSVVLIGLMLLVIYMGGATDGLYYEYAYLALLLVFLLSATWIVGSQVLLTGSVDLNIIIGSVALYLLIGLTWSLFYTILLEFSPGALSGVQVSAWYDNIPVTNYFSFVTLTTLGYGDISPVTPVARLLVVFEAVTGMFYLAVIVASLVGAIRNKS